MKKICKNCKFSHLVAGDKGFSADYLTCLQVREIDPDSESPAQSLSYGIYGDILNGFGAVIKVAPDFGCCNFLEKDVHPSRD